jgi:hypothetical protein
MARNKYPTQIPPVAGWGGTRSIVKRLQRSTTLVNNKEATAYALLAMANTKITDIMTWDENGNVKVKPSCEIPESALMAIKNIKVRSDKNGASTLEIDLYDKVAVLRILARASGLLDNPGDDDKPSVISINVKSPDVVDVTDNRGMDSHED